MESDESESDEIMDTNPNLEAETCSSEIGHSSLGQNDKTSDVTFIYPKRVIEEFTKRAAKYKAEDGSPMELLAYLVGHIAGDVLIGKELIFPNQFGTFRVWDDGIRDSKRDIKYNSKNWISKKSWTANKYPGKATILARSLLPKIK